MEQFFQTATAREIIEATHHIMNDPEAQRKLAEELDAEGMGVNFSGLIPSIFCKEIHVSSNWRRKEFDDPALNNDTKNTVRDFGPPGGY
jgi:hypothetical protein